MSRSKIALFIDVENLTYWLKQGGAEKLVTELSSTGQLIVRKAYGNWGNGNIQTYQQELNRQGFELVHSFHPVSGKNSSDIQMTVDVMESALRLSSVDWFVLATGDSDFSPLFRRLREMGKEVVGVGPRSPLSDSVKTSCTRYIYTDSPDEIDHDTLSKELKTAIDLTHKALKTFDGAAHCSALKNRIIALNSAFNEERLGYASFTVFLNDIGSIEVFQQNTIWHAQIKTNPPTQTMHVIAPDSQKACSQYKQILKKKCRWPTVRTDLISTVFNIAYRLDAMPKSTIADAIQDSSRGSIKSTDALPIVRLFFKAKLYMPAGLDSMDRSLFSLRNETNLLETLDTAMITRILGYCERNCLSVDASILQQILYGVYDRTAFDRIYQHAEKIRLNSSETSTNQ